MDVFAVQRLSRQYLGRLISGDGRTTPVLVLLANPLLRVETGGFSDLRFVKDYAGAIASMVVSMLVFVGCGAALSPSPVASELSPAPRSAAGLPAQLVG